MPANRQVIIVSLLAAASLGAPLWATHQEPAATPAERRAAASKTPEMDRLKFYLGVWDYTETYPKSKFYPAGATNSGIYTSKLGPGGNSLINEFHSQGPGGESEGLLVMTWDPTEKTYNAYVFGGEFSGALQETGTWQGDTLVYTAEWGRGPKKFKLRNTTRVTGPGQLISEEFSAADGAPETLLVTVKATRRK